MGGCGAVEESTGGCGIVKVAWVGVVIGVHVVQ